MAPDINEAMRCPFVYDYNILTTVKLTHNMGGFSDYMPRWPRRQLHLTRA